MSARNAELALRALDRILAGAGPDDGQFNREDLEFVRTAMAEQQALLAEAGASALEDVDNYVDEVMFHIDTETDTGPLVAGRGPLMALLRQHAAKLRSRAKRP